MTSYVDRPRAPSNGFTTFPDKRPTSSDGKRRSSNGSFSHSLRSQRFVASEELNMELQRAIRELLQANMKESTAGAQSAVLLDSANNLPAAIAAYSQSVRLLEEVMLRCEEALERERERNQKLRESEDAEDPRKRERREKRERLKEDEARRLRVIHDTYADRIRMLRESVPERDAALKASNTAGPEVERPHSRRATLSEVTSAPVITIDDRSGSPQRKTTERPASPPASPMDPVFGAEQLLIAREANLNPATPTQERRMEDEQTPRPGEQFSRSTKAEDEPVGRKLVYNSASEVGLGVLMSGAHDQSHNRQKSHESITSFHRPTSSYYSTQTDSNRTSGQTSTTTVDEAPAPPPKAARASYQRSSSLAASPTLRTSDYNDSTLSEYASGQRASGYQRPPLQTAQTAPAVPLAIQVAGRRSASSSVGAASVSPPEFASTSSRSVSRRSSASALGGPPARVAQLPPVPTELLEPLASVRQPFRLLRLIVASIAQGGFVTPKLFVPRTVWEQPIKLAKLESKIRLLDEMANACENGRLEDIVRAADGLREGSKKLVSQKDNKASWGNKMLSKGLEKMNSRGGDSLPAYCDAITRSALAAQVLDRQLADIDRRTVQERDGRTAALHRLSDFYATNVCPVVLGDVATLLDKYVKRMSGWAAND